jgi:hypothetical protein
MSTPQCSGRAVKGLQVYTDCHIMLYGVLENLRVFRQPACAILLPQQLLKLLLLLQLATLSGCTNTASILLTATSTTTTYCYYCRH